MLLVLICCASWCGAVDLFQAVPGKDPAYAALRHLDHCGLFTDSGKLRAKVAARTLTRFDIAYALTEPLMQFVALGHARGARSDDPAQQQRELLLRATLAALSPADREQVFTEIGQLVTTYGEDIEQFQPGLSAQAAEALRKMPLLTALSAPPLHSSAENPPRVSLSVSSTPTTPVISLLPPFVTTHGSDARLFNEGGTDTGAFGTFPVKTWEAAINFMYHGVGANLTLGTLPGANPLQNIVNPESLGGLAKLGLTVDLLRFRDWGVKGIFEYQLERYTDSGMMNTNHGVVGGIGLNW